MERLGLTDLRGRRPHVSKVRLLAAPLPISPSAQLSAAEGRRRPVLQTREGWALFAVTLYGNVLNAGFFWWMKDGTLIPPLLDGSWIIPSAFFLHRLIPRVVLVTPAVGLAVSAGYALVWLFHRDRYSRRMGLLWTIALITAIIGWPVACGCIGMEGYARGVVRN